MDRNANSPRLIGDGARDGLPHPPSGVGGELVAPAVVEFVHGLHQADVAFLNQIQELQSAVGVTLGDGDNQAQVGFDELLLGGLGFLFAAFDDLQRAAKLGGTCATFLLELLDALARLAQFLAQVARGMPAMCGLFELALNPAQFRVRAASVLPRRNGAGRPGCGGRWC